MSVPDLKIADSSPAQRRPTEDTFPAPAEDPRHALLVLQRGRPVYADPALCELTGRPEAELLAMSPTDVLGLFHPDERGNLSAVWESGRTEIARFEARIVRKDLTVAWCEFFTHRTAYNHGEALRMVIVDITDRKEAEAATREMNAWHRTVIDLSPDLVVAHVDWKIVLANKAAADLLGYATPDDLLGQTVLDFAIPGMREIHRARYQRLISGQDTEPIETEVVGPNGTLRDLQVHTTLTRFKGRPAVLIVGHDVTDRKSSEMALQRARAELERRVDERTIELAVANASLLAQISARERTEAELRRTNAEMQALYTVATRTPRTVDLETILYTVLDQMWLLSKPNVTWAYLEREGATFTAHRGIRRGNPDGREDAIRAIIDRANAEVMQSGSLIIQPSDPQHAPSAGVPVGPSGFRTVAFPIKDAQHTVGVLGAVTPDGSAGGKQVTLQDLRFLQSLAQQVSMIVENIQAARAKAEVDLLRQIDKLRSELIANFSHDLKSPLGVIKFSSTTLMREDVRFGRDVQTELLTDIVQQTDLLSLIVEQILELAALESAGLRLRLGPVDLVELCSQVVGSIRRHSPDHEFRVDFEPAEFVVHADAQRIGVVFGNLIDNAIKYSPGGGCVSIQGRMLADRALITITDNGIGIPQEDMRHIFERFYRGRNSVTASTSGTGLGLPLCRGIVQAHAGKIWLESQPGEGTTVSFTLPIAVGQTQEVP